MGERAWLLGVLSAACLCVGVGCGDRGTGGTLATVTSGGLPERVAGNTLKVDPRDVVGYDFLRASLYVPPGSSVPITTSDTAPVEAVKVVPGQSVRAGQTLVKLADVGGQERYTEARADLVRAEEACSGALDQLRQPVEYTRVQLDHAKEQLELDRNDALQGADDTDVLSAEQTLAQARLQLTQARSRQRTALQPYLRDLSAAKAEMAAASHAMQGSVIVAPISGTVMSIGVVPGDEVGITPDAAIGTVTDLDALQVKARLTDSQMQHARPGTPVELQFKDLPSRMFEGRIDHIRTLPSEDGTAIHEATIAFENKGHPIKPDSVLVRAAIRIGEVRNVVAVPVSTIHWDPDGNCYVDRLVNDKWQHASVTVGLSDGKYVEIKSGISEGDTILSR